MVDMDSAFGILQNTQCLNTIESFSLLYRSLIFPRQIVSGRTYSGHDSAYLLGVKDEMTMFYPRRDITI